MNINLPTKVRFVIYIITGVGSIVAIYLSNASVIGVNELELWTGLSVFANGLAALNTKEIK